MEDKIYGGAFQVARQIFDSEIWLKKPSSWKTIWIYIFGNVNHQDNGKFKRGEGFFNFSRELKQIGCDITYDMIRHAMTYFKKNGMLSTKRSTRGIIVKVLKYNNFQTLDNYQSTIASTSKAQAKHKQSTPINKNVNNVNNEKNNTYVEKWNEFLEPKVSVLTKDRKVKLKVRLNEKLFLDNYDKILGIIKDTPFLRGENNNNWAADFDWIIANDTNYIKILEGKYKKAKQAQQPKKIMGLADRRI